jgi:hypothetical protein
MTKKQKASESILNELHDRLAQDMLTRLKDGEPEVVNGEVVLVKPKPATLNAIRQFLKDNGVEGAAEENTPLRNLAEELSHINVDELSN